METTPHDGTLPAAAGAGGTYLVSDRTDLEQGTGASVSFKLKDKKSVSKKATAEKKKTKAAKVTSKSETGTAAKKTAASKQKATEPSKVVAKKPKTPKPKKIAKKATPKETSSKK
nr:histone H1.1-like [Aedes albopictus]